MDADGRKADNVPAEGGTLVRGTPPCVGVVVGGRGRRPPHPLLQPPRPGAPRLALAPCRDGGHGWHTPGVSRLLAATSRGLAREWGSHTKPSCCQPLVLCASNTRLPLRSPQPESPDRGRHPASGTLHGRGEQHR